MKKWLPILFTILSLTAYGQTIPAVIAVPQGTKLILHAYAKGVQMYVCAVSPKDTSQYVWNLVGPRASLYSRDDYRQQVGKHYFSPENEPTWESTDGSKVVGVKLQQADAPDSSALSWLLLKATSTSGYGPLQATTFIQRVNTKGGKAPSEGADRLHKGQYVEVAYTAEYLFYRTK
jgi:hypothetical protein